MIGVMAVMFMSALDQTIVGTAMPRVIADLQGFTHYSGVLTAYMVASTTVVPIAGKLSDFYGRKNFLLVGVVAFVGASALCGAAGSMDQLIVFRGLQGVGAGIIQAMSFTTLADLFPPARRGKVMGFMGAVFGLASVIGPVVGGFLTDGPGWRYVFYVNLPIGLVAWLILFFSFPHVRVRREHKPSIDYLGAGALVCSIVPLLLALSWGGRDYSWSSSVVTGLLVFGGVMSVVLFAVERRAAEPIIPLKLFKNRIVWTCMAASGIVSVGMFGTTLFIPLFIQAVIGTSATRSGTVLMPMTFAMVLASIMTGQLVSRLGRYRIFAITGVCITALGMALLALMDVNTQNFTIMRNVVVMGFGIGMTMPVFSLAVQNAVDIRQVGTATSTVQFVRSVGGALGTAVFGSVLVNRFVPIFHDSLPPWVKAQVSAEQLAKFDNPQILMGRGAGGRLGSVFASFGNQADAVREAVVGAARVGLADALHMIFLTAAILLGLGVLVTLLLRDIPLRKTNRPVESAH